MGQGTCVILTCAQKHAGDAKSSKLSSSTISQLDLDGLPYGIATIQILTH